MSHAAHIIAVFYSFGNSNTEATIQLAAEHGVALHYGELNDALGATLAEGDAYAVLVDASLEATRSWVAAFRDTYGQHWSVGAWEPTAENFDLLRLQRSGRSG